MNLISLVSDLYVSGEMTLNVRLRVVMCSSTRLAVHADVSASTLEGIAYVFDSVAYLIGIDEGSFLIFLPKVHLPFGSTGTGLRPCPAAA